MAGKAGCLRAPAARKATVQRRDSPLGELPPRPPPGEGVASGHTSTEGGGEGAPGRARAAGWRGAARSAGDFFSDLVVLDEFWTCSGGRGEAPARAMRRIYSGLQWVTVGIALWP